MYYSYPCTYCGKVFYTFNNDKFAAAKVLYAGIKKHLTDYDEDHKEFEMDEAPEIEENQMYDSAAESKEPPAGGYEI